MPVPLPNPLTVNNPVVVEVPIPTLPCCGNMEREVFDDMDGVDPENNTAALFADSVSSPSAEMVPILVRFPSVDISQSDELICKVSPPSPKSTAPPGVRVNAPVVVNVVDAPSNAILVSAIVTSPLESNVPVTVRVCPEGTVNPAFAVIKPPVVNAPEVFKVAKEVKPKTSSDESSDVPEVTVSDLPTPTLPVETSDPPIPTLPKNPVPETCRGYVGSVVPTPTLPLSKTVRPWVKVGPEYVWNVTAVPVPAPLTVNAP